MYSCLGTADANQNPMDHAGSWSSRGCAPIQCVVFGPSPNWKCRTACSCRRSAFVTRWCWRRCSSQESVRKVSMNRPSSAGSSNMPQSYAPSRRRASEYSARARKNSSQRCGSMRYSIVTSTGPRSGSIVRVVTGSGQCIEGEKSTLTPVCSFQRHVSGIATLAPAAATTRAAGNPATAAISPHSAHRPRNRFPGRRRPIPGHSQRR